MSNIEHLIESAVYYVENYSFEEFKETWTTNINKQGISATLEEIWDIATWIYYSYRPYIDYKKSMELIDAYGYEVK